MVGKPLGDNLRDCNARHVAAHTKHAEAKGRDEHLRLDVGGNEAEKRDVQMRVLQGGEIGQCIVVDECAAHHHACGQESGKADAHLVEDDASDEEHQQEDVEDAVRTGIEAVFLSGPAHSALR